MKRVCMLLIIGICCFAFSIGAEENITEIHLVSEEWEEGTNADGTGFYWDLFRLIYEPVGITMQFQIFPYSRCAKMVQDQDADALVGSYIDEIEDVLYPKYHFDADDVTALFLKKNDIEWQGQQTLEGKRVGWMRGYAYDEYLDVPVQKFEVNNRESALRMINRERLEFFLDARADIEYELEEDYAKDQAQNYQMEEVLELRLYLAFANNERGKALQKIFDERIEALIASGELQQFYDSTDYTDYPFAEEESQ